MKLGVAKEIFVDDFWFVVEATHWARATNMYNTTRESPGEVGVALRFDRHVLILVGASAGVNDGVGAPTCAGSARSASSSDAQATKRTRCRVACQRLGRAR